MLLRNLTPDEGLCNGTYLQLTHIGRFIPGGQIWGGRHQGEKRLFPRIIISTAEWELQWIVSRRQVPIRFCFTTTVKNPQDQPLHTVGVDLHSLCSTNGQSSAALSRVADISSLCVFLSELCDGITSTVMYPEVLLREPVT